LHRELLGNVLCEWKSEEFCVPNRWNAFDLIAFNSFYLYNPNVKVIEVVPECLWADAPALPGYRERHQGPPQSERPRLLAIPIANQTRR
jgi:hypothetical protein